MSMIDLLKRHVTNYTWFSVTNIYFDNSFVINPHAQAGYVAYSQSAECFFALGKIDSTNSELFEKKYIVMCPRHNEFQQTITCVGFDHFQHFDAALFSHSHFYKEDDTEMPIPTYPNMKKLMALTPNAETGLIDSVTEKAVLQSGSEVDLEPIYPDHKYEEDYSYVRILNYQTFIRNQQKFAAAMNKMFGVSDCM